jgi:uncharacterized membrane protein
MVILVRLIIGFGVYYLLKNNTGNGLNNQSKSNSVELLKQRYINGEIDEETYKRMLNLLND